MLIPLANSDLFAEVDDDLADVALMHKWRLMFDKRLQRHTYVYTTLPGMSGILALHLFLFGPAPDGMIHDHIDGNGRNNTRANMRYATRAQNSWNRASRRDSASGIKGVMLETCGPVRADGTRLRKWRATVVANGKRHKQWFATPELADAWACAKRAELHGEFACHSERLGSSTNTQPADEAR